MSDILFTAIFGSFISLLLIVNAYFTRETLVRLVSIELKLGNQVTKQEYNEKQLDFNTKEIKDLRDRIHQIEGYQPAILKILETK